MTKKERMNEVKKKFLSMEINKLTKETKDKMKNLQEVNLDMFLELVRTKKVISAYKFKKKVRVFFDEQDDKFLYYNPIFRKLFTCGKFVD